MSDYKWPLMKNSISLWDRVQLAKFVLTSDKFTQGENVERFEKEWSKWLGCKYSLFVTSGSTANFLLVSSIIEKYGLEKGDKVLVPSCTWVTNINPIIQLGLTPIFCDVNLENYSFDLDNLKIISELHQDIKMVFVTHLLGIPAEIEEYRKIFPNALFIDDVCESHGCLDKSENKIGKNSLGATFSFYFGHHMSTVEGGMISTDSWELYDLMKMKRSHGLARVSDQFKYYQNQNLEIEKSFLFVSDGYNFRNTEFGAVLGLSQLKRLDKFIENRDKTYTRFVEIMSAPKNKDNFYPVVYNEGNSCFCFPFICRTKEIKSKLISLLDKYKIEYRPVVGGNLLRQPYLKNYSISGKTENLNVDIIHENGIYIGNNQFVSNRDMDLLEIILGEL
jgi:CDP-6-deoxy-D-xylo-4-hexulose-3-dehydrase